MPALSNDPARCEVLNLGYGPHGHGPYLVRQLGYPPGSTTLRADHFILQKNGTWLLNLAYVMLPEAEQERQLFPGLRDIALFLDDLSGRPLAADGNMPAGHSAEEILARFAECTHHILRGMRAGVVVSGLPHPAA